MEDKEKETYETKTNLLSCEDVVAYLWAKCDKFSSPFKPEGAAKIDDRVTFSDSLSGEVLKREYHFKGEDIKAIALKNGTEYEVDTMEFSTLDADGEKLSEGNLLVVYRSYEKYYAVFLLENEKDVKLLVKCAQKKKLFESFPTETVTFF